MRVIIIVYEVKLDYGLIDLCNLL